MNVKEFLKPTMLKILILIILMLITTFPERSLYISSALDGGGMYGLPFPIYKTSGGFISLQLEIPVRTSIFHIESLIINLAFWYTISCLIIFGYNKVNK